MTANLEKLMKKIGLSSDVSDFDNESYLKDRLELEKIANSLPSDGVLDYDNCLKLLRLSIRGLNICDEWIPKLHIITTLYEVERDKARADAYINAKLPKEGRITVEMRKASSEVDEEYNKMKLMVEKVKSTKLFHEKKRDTLKAAYFMFRDQLLSYKLSDKGNTGDSLEYIDENKKTGKMEW
jgi:hypothetical protein